MVQKYCRKVPACAYGAAKSQTNDRQTTDGRQTDGSCHKANVT